MALARALTPLLHNSFMYQPGETFEFEGELKGDISEGMEWVTKKTTAAFEKTQADALQALQDTANALRHAYADLKAQLEADPTRNDLVQPVLDAEIAAQEAEKAVTAAQPDTDLV